MKRVFSRPLFGLLLGLLAVSLWQPSARAQEEPLLPPDPPAETLPLAAPPPILPIPSDAPLVEAVAPQSQNNLLFCNTPEKIRMGGAVADYKLQAGMTYTIFYHYRNVSTGSGPFVIALHGTGSGPLRFTARRGVADPQHDPPLAGRQAMARFLQAGESAMTGKNNMAHFAHPLKPGQVASGVLTVRCEKSARLRIYFKHDKWTVPGAGVVSVPDPRKEIAVALSPHAKSVYYRIGIPAAGCDRRLDGTYGMLYAFRVAAPQGRRVRVLFCPRGGKAGLVGSIGGKMTQSGIVAATRWAIFSETTVGKNGVVLTTAPFGGVFYPVELLFQLI